MKADGSDAKKKTEEKGLMEKRPLTVKDVIHKMEEQFGLALPKHLQKERMTRILITAVSANPKLAQCEMKSLIGGMMQAAQMGLEPNTPLGQCYLIPYFSKKKGVYECTLQLGYKGILDLAYRAGIYAFIYAKEVYEEDEFSYKFGLHPALDHVPADKNEGKPTHYYAVYKTLAGGADFRVWSIDQVLAHAMEFSQSWTGNGFKAGSPWAENFDSMAKKTVLLDLLKYAPKNVEVREGRAIDRAIRVDNQVQNAEIRGEEITIVSDYDEENVDDIPEEKPITSDEPAITSDNPEQVTEPDEEPELF
jgi:recombination protein RecT